MSDACPYCHGVPVFYEPGRLYGDPDIVDVCDCQRRQDAASALVARIKTERAARDYADRKMEERFKEDDPE